VSAGPALLWLLLCGGDVCDLPRESTLFRFSMGNILKIDSCIPIQSIAIRKLSFHILCCQKLKVLFKTMANTNHLSNTVLFKQK
jgi:hypothetical protein